MVMTAALAAIATSLRSRSAGGDLAVFEPEALGLEDAEELLDQPAPLVHSTMCQASSAVVTA